jgi:hypothetical protein
MTLPLAARSAGGVETAFLVDEPLNVIAAKAYGMQPHQMHDP